MSTIQLPFTADQVVKGLTTANDQLFFQAKAYIARLTHPAGTGPVQEEIILNSTGRTFVWSRDAAGIHRATLQGPGGWDSAAVMCGGAFDPEQAIEYQCYAASNSSVFFVAVKDGADYSDGWLNSHLVYILFFGLSDPA